ncbi:MAG: HAMP domain-containing protein [gamma proteobacterium symbiont of Taylorina sp.]|nr:HAMP domain-containing protein [gamma proteobacterium symbiont of Taylorina sp.]
MKIIFYKKIRFKFIAAFVTVMLASFVLSYFININAIHKSIKTTAKHQFNSALHLTENFIDFVGQTSQIWVHHIINEGRLTRLLITGEPDQIKQMLDLERQSVAADTIILLDKKGRVITQSGSIREIGDSLSSLDIVKNIIVPAANQSNKKITTISRELDNFIIYSRGEILDQQEELQGILLVGYFITEEFLDNIKKNTNIDLAIVGNTAIMGSTKWADKQYISELPLPFLTYQRILEHDLFSNIRFMGRNYLIAAKKMKFIESSFSGSILMALPAEKFTDIETKIVKDMAQLFLFLLVFVIVIVFFFSKPFLKSIEKLSTVSSSLADGNFASRVKIKSRDEFQQVADNFNSMAEEIEKKTLALHQLNKNLENRITEEVQKSHEKDQLIMAQSRHAAMGEMISMIAHQWRQPLSVITMTANNILADIEFEQVNNKDLENEAQAMIKQSRYLSNTIEDFRNFFRPDKKKELSKPETVLESSFEIIGKALENNNIKITRHYSIHSPILMYIQETMQVFLNILKNAQEAMVESIEENREIDICITENDTMIETTICNNGASINEDILVKIFEPYFSTKSKKNGTGLGLYMSKMIIEQHMNGIIIAYNDHDKACFKIALPKNNE